jgi:hypothetical protein
MFLVLFATALCQVLYLGFADFLPEHQAKMSAPEVRWAHTDDPDPRINRRRPKAEDGNLFSKRIHRRGDKTTVKRERDLRLGADG